jgi:uncharacterized protein
MRNFIILFMIQFVSIIAWGQTQKDDSLYMRQHYDKFEYQIPMRDGAKLFTIVYIPKERGVQYPILMHRTPYNASIFSDYKTYFRIFCFPNRYLIRDKYILVYQDVRGRYMSEGIFDNMRPNIPGNNPKNKNLIDESSDTWDTIEWLLKNIKNNNGRVGIYGISYPGFYAVASIPDAHPALKAVSPQAPVADLFFDDFHHMGAFTQSYTHKLSAFDYPRESLTKNDWFMPKRLRFYGQTVPDAYDFYLKIGSLKNITNKYHYDNQLWEQIIEHPNYDDFWQKRNILPHLSSIKPAVLTVGGWLDAEDLYGPLNVYKTIEKNSTSIFNAIVMGPWGHGDWAAEQGKSVHNHIYFGDSISTFYQKEIERKFFSHFLKDESINNLPEAFMFDTGLKQWKKIDKWPSNEFQKIKLHFGEKGRLLINESGSPELSFEYLSDPLLPVPYVSQIEGFTGPRSYMSDDQRQASKRPDVLTFQTEALSEDMTLAGEILVKLIVSMTGSDADFVVKLIDVYPADHPNYNHNPKNIVMGGYQQLIRSEIFRGRFRNSFEKPEPFKPNAPTKVEFPLQDILHTIKKGHRIMIQIHSTWFPLVDRNPQKFVDNIYKAEEGDFVKSTIRIHGESVLVIGN